MASKYSLSSPTMSALSERVSADDMVGLLNEYFDAMARLVFKHEGTIDKWIGDAVMAFFGAPEPQEDHARRALRMSIEMQGELQRLNERWKAEERFARMGVPDYPGLRIGIGCHSGEANVGFLGAKSSRMDYTAGQIVVSRATVDTAAFGFDFRPLEPMQLKGKSEVVETFELVYEGAPSL